MGLKPSFRIQANNSDITEAIRARFRSMTITDVAGVTSDSLRISLSDHDRDNPIIIPPTGAELEVWIGYDDAATRMGLFVVSGIDLSGPPDSMVIKAKAAPQKQSAGGKTALQTRKTRSWDAGLTLGGLVQTIATEHNMTAAVPADLASEVLPHYDQVGESDMNLLTRVAKTYDAIAKPAGGQLIITKRAESQTVSGDPLPAISLARQDLTDWSVSIEERESFGTIQAHWHDKDAAEEKTVTAGSGEPVKILRGQFRTAEEAQAAANAEKRKADRGNAKLSASLPGRTDIIAESRLAISGVRPGVNGDWLVTKVTHAIDSGGYRISINAETPQ